MIAFSLAVRTAVASLVALVGVGCTGGASPAGTEPAVSVPPTGAPGAPAAAVAAEGIQFSVSNLVVPADTEFTLTFENRDAGVPHDLDIIQGRGNKLDDNEIATGPAEVTYEVPALPAGEYEFMCSVHPNMVGTLTAE